MSGATRSPETDGHPDGPIINEQGPGLDTIIESFHGLTLTYEPALDSLLSFEPTDEILRLTATSKIGHVKLYRSHEPTKVMLDWILTAWSGKAEKKTLSILIQGHGLSPVVAKSGWARSLNQDTSDVYSPINGTNYTEMAWQLCRSLKCSLKPNKAIEPAHRPGYFEASHAEMHLITWFVERYFPRLLEDGAENWKTELPRFLENILIISNRTPYPSYRKLADRVKELTGVTITIEYRGPDM